MAEKWGDESRGGGKAGGEKGISGMLMEAMTTRPFSLFVFCVSASPIGTGGPWCGCPCVAGAVVGEEGPSGTSKCKGDFDDVFFGRCFVKFIDKVCGWGGGGGVKGWYGIDERDWR